MVEAPRAQCNSALPLLGFRTLVSISRACACELLKLYTVSTNGNATGWRKGGGRGAGRAGCACCGDSGHTTATTHDNYLPPRRPRARASWCWRGGDPRSSATPWSVD